MEVGYGDREIGERQWRGVADHGGYLDSDELEQRTGVLWRLDGESGGGVGCFWWCE